MRRSAAETRVNVLQITHDLFYWNGIHAVGVDRVAEEAGVAPTTLYRLFRSKDELVAAYVERGGVRYLGWFEAALGDTTRHPRERILALFDALTEQVQPPGCRGCPFLMALAEYPDPAHPAHERAVAVKTRVRTRLGELTDALHVDTSAELADDLTLVLEGVYASVQAIGAHGPARRARALAEALITAAERTTEG